MSEQVNFNLSQPQEIRNIVYWNEKKGYRAILNGKVIALRDMETVVGLTEIMPCIKVNFKDLEKFEKALSIDGKAYEESDLVYPESAFEENNKN